MRRKDHLHIGAIFITLAFAVGAWPALSAQKAGAAHAPRFEVDPLWPKPLPNHWVLGSVTGVAVDDQDHVWIIHRGADSLANNEKGAILKPPTGCCVPAPQVLEFDQGGNLVGHWGGPGQGYEWPESNHGITIDSKGFVWIGGNGNSDAHVLKFTREGKFVAQFGHKGKNAGSNDVENFGRVAKIFVDGRANEAYIADGYLNKRVAVIDADTGKIKRYWGAYGNKPDDDKLGPYDPNGAPAKQFRAVTCVAGARDGMVYVCDAQSDRIQVFTRDGKFVKEAAVSKATLADGSVWDIALSKDPQQRFLYVADGQDKKVLVLRRDTLEVIGSFGEGGRLPGQFYAVGSIAVDSKGNVYTGETSEGKRVQKFVFKGMGAAGQMK